ncbi:MAG: RelA/SpoT family protein [Candidatus Eisenbacteria bacterium]|nr:RelA/SpoT family protein [Candidatus Eisenbacteria bacterium]
MDGSEFAAEVLRIDPCLDDGLVARARETAARAHAGQMRESGDPYVTHCEEVARILAGMELDTASVAAGLLHDTIEETDLTLDDLRKEFGREITELVDGVTKITGLRLESRESEQAEYFRKMLLSVVKDVRVILIKLADRLHNMRTIEFLDSEHIRRISLETRDIYAPLAARFGMARLQRELDDLAFRWLEPEAYESLEAEVAATRGARDAMIEKFARPIRERLEEEGVEATVTGRVKHLASIHRKMVSRGKAFGEIYDVLAVRMVTDTVGSCYRILGIVHTLYVPVHDRIKDFIATPKLNGYRSLHTTVVGPEGQMVEVQIRTGEMHEEAECGIAAHWSYKEGRPCDAELTERLRWVRQLLEGSVEPGDADEFLESLKFDLYSDEIFVFTPRGDLKQLRRGSSPIDFAYAVHTDVGNHCAGARVNGRLVSLRHELKSGDTVDIVTSDAAHPTRDWLALAASSRARSKIRHYLREQADGESVALGRRIIDREIRKAGKKAKGTSLDDLAQSLGLDGARELAAAVGRGEIVAETIAQRLTPQRDGARGLVDRLTRRVRRPETGVRIDGLSDIMITFAKCCQPVPGDQITGIVTRGRGISVHRVGCPNTFGPTIDDAHRVPIEWDVRDGQTFPASFVVRGDLRSDFLADVSRAIADEGVEVTGATMSTEGGEASARFRVEVGNLHRLKRLIRIVRRLKGVASVERRRPPSGGRRRRRA